MSGGQVIVVGGGPAGSLAGLLLARRGFAVQLLEQHRFPRDKVCGECLSAVGLDVLDRAGLIDELRLANPTVLVRTLIHPASGSVIDLPLPKPMWGLSRSTLDQRLLAAAVAAGVVVRQPVRCERVVGGVRPSVVWRDLQSNQIATAEADWVVVADGKSALMGAVPPPTGDIGIKAHFTGVDGPRDAIELFAGPGCYGGLAAVDGDRWNAAFSVPAARLREASGNVQAVFAAVTEHNPTLGRRMATAAQVGGWLAAPLPRFGVVSTWPAGVVPVGNAAAALEPIGGEGMGLALRSTELAVSTLAGAGRSRRRLVSGYRDLWRTRRLACRLAAQVVSNCRWIGVTSDLMAGDPHLARLALRLVGKSVD